MPGQVILTKPFQWFEMLLHPTSACFINFTTHHIIFKCIAIYYIQVTTKLPINALLTYTVLARSLQQIYIMW